MKKAPPKRVATVEPAFIELPAFRPTLASQAKKKTANPSNSYFDLKASTEKKVSHHKAVSMSGGRLSELSSKRLMSPKNGS